MSQRTPEQKAHRAAWERARTAKRREERQARLAAMSEEELAAYRAGGREKDSAKRGNLSPQAREKRLAYQREWGRSHRPQMYEAQRRYRETEKGRAYTERTSRRRLERLKLLRAERAKLKPPKKVKARINRPDPIAPSILVGRALGDDALFASLARGLPRHVCDEVISEIAVGLLSGEISRNDVTKAIRKMVGRYLGEVNRTLSLDVKVPGKSGKTYLDKLTTEDALYAQ